ncbi:MAG: RluA family pseudouridine synthase [Spirochaetaceae bacterium]|jgi:23S rRNA pseudouridine955/2504/2580 synthase|nr:RluA family pseudouridine synthase [Spirochaetaceae bacterium]
MALELITGADDGGRRLDRILRKALPELSLSELYRLLRKGRILVDGKAGRADDRIAPGARIQLPPNIGRSYPSGPYQKRPLPAGAAPLPALDILWEGAGLLFLNKAPGLLVHGPGDLKSLETQVLHYLRGKLPPSLSFKPGPLHRLDRPTSGIVAFSTGLEGARNFSALLRQGKIKKQYLALVEGEVGEEEVWENWLFRDREQKKTFSTGNPGEKAQRALTRVWKLISGSGYTLVRLEIATGRTHQIRAQAALHGYPLAGDRKYGGGLRKGHDSLEPSGSREPQIFLHAATLEFLGEGMADVPKIIKAPLPEAFLQRIHELFGDKFAKILDPPSL